MGSSAGQGSIGFSPKVPQSGPPFSLTSADNGLSVDPVSGRIVIGQAVGEAGDPAQLLSNREIPLKGFSFVLGEAGDIHLSVNPTARVYTFGDVSAVGNGTFLSINDANQIFEMANNGSVYLTLDVLNNYYALGDDYNATNGGVFIIDNGQGRIQMKNLINGNISSRVFDIRNSNNTYSIGDLDNNNNGMIAMVNDANGRYEIFNTANTALVRINGVNGVTGVFAPVNSITVNGGIVTAVT